MLQLTRMLAVQVIKVCPGKTPTNRPNEAESIA
jgi:hypothetical protein